MHDMRPESQHIFLIEQCFEPKRSIFLHFMPREEETAEEKLNSSGPGLGEEEAQSSWRC